KLFLRRRPGSNCYLESTVRRVVIEQVENPAGFSAGEAGIGSSPILSTVVNTEFSELPSITLPPVWIQAWAMREESSENFTPATMTAGIPRRRSIMNAAIDRLRHRLFHGKEFAVRDNESSTSLMSSAW